MKKIYLVLLVVLISCAANAQKPVPNPAPLSAVNEYAAIDKTALALPAAQATTTQGIAGYVNAHFTSNTDKARAIFIWTASNIRYDVDNMFATNFYEAKHDKIDKALKTNKGICENYAAIFADVAVKCGIQAYVVEGYTKQIGFTDYIPHSWCAARIDGAWYLFDPTWGSGYVSQKQFIKKINNSYFKALPSSLIKSHMPFDPMWELLPYPISNQEFSDGRTEENKAKPYFDYADSITVYEKENETAQMQDAARRVEANGVNNALIYDRLNHLKMTIETNKENRNVTEYNTAVADFNDAVNLYNDYIQYYNVQFKPTKPDPEIKQMIDPANKKMTSARNHLDNIQDAKAATIALMASLRKSMSDFQPRIDEQEEFLAKYFTKSKMGRKMMFHKLTLMGAPVN